MIVVAGEALVDLIEQIDTADASSPVYTAHLGGGPFNASVALGSLGRGVGYLFPLSEDRYGHRLSERLSDAGVDLLLDARSPGSTPLALVGLDAAGKASYRFYRQGTADRDFTAESLIAKLPARPDAVVTGTLAIAEGRDPEALSAVLAEGRRRGAVTVVDPNMRPEAYPDREGYARKILGVLRGADLVKASDDDLAVLYPGLAAEAALARLINDCGAGLAVMTRGSDGALAITATQRVEVPAYLPPTFGDTVGAGDCFLAGLVDRLVPAGSNGGLNLPTSDAETIREALDQAVVVAGLNCAVSGCNPPARDAVDAILGTRTGVRSESR